jgi:hypothetical protein
MEQTLLEWFQNYCWYQPYYPGENPQREKNLRLYEKVSEEYKVKKAQQLMEEARKKKVEANDIEQIRRLSTKLAKLKRESEEPDIPF